MSSINSISSYVQPLASAKACQDDYTINAGLYGPVVASAIGVANAAADSVSAICSFSAESLEKLGDMADAGYDAVGTALSDTGDAVESALDSVTNGFTQLYTDVAAMASDGLDTLGDVGQTVSNAAEEVIDSIEDGLSDAATAVSDAASSVIDGIGTAASNVAGLVSLGVTAGTLS
ncbi:MAG: hypothetical protein Q8K91_09920 [Hylemonella sp.]|nr:hypothetical protein [Hylemonella sp.]MDP1937507.1 hypothetical protein [Hylemonella sp.]